MHAKVNEGRIIGRTDLYFDYMILMAIALSPGDGKLSMAKIGRLIGLSTASVHLHIHKLSKRGFISVKSINRKRVQYRITNDGVKLILTLAQKAIDETRKLISDLGDITSMFDSLLRSGTGSD